ncbi:2OG-Fe(II) oxygenase [Streptomyces sp. NPDC014734]|uniref:2OG-Fe(II) oxygenase n=1 Tax=Streptomyces sp. NPDC014734 TaxID=3364886 RepID=UPI0036FBA163
MMPTFETDDFAIFDDFLPSADLAEIQNYFRSGRFTYVKSLRSRSSVFGHLDGDPLTGPSVFHHFPEPPKGSKAYPAGNAMDRMVEHIENEAERLSRWSGKKEEHWDFFTCTPYLYPLGAGLSWHDDIKGGKTASYTFYAHDEWKDSWGAELLVSGGGTLRTDKGNPKESGGFGHYIAPLPNRLVIIKAGTPHTVKRVEINAGENIRASLTGFFMKKTE